MVKNLPTMRKTRVRSLGQEDPLGKGRATHSSILAWRIPWTEAADRLQPMGSQSRTAPFHFLSPKMKTGSQPPSLGLCLHFSEILSPPPYSPFPNLCPHVPLVLPYPPIVQLRKLRLRKQKQHVQGHTQQQWDPITSWSSALPRPRPGSQRRHIGSCLLLYSLSPLVLVPSRPGLLRVS